MKIKLPLTILLFFCYLFTQAQGTATDSVKTKSDTAKVQTAPPPPAPTQPPPQSSGRKDTRPMRDRIDFGFGTSFWTNSTQTYVEVSPMIAYHFPAVLTIGGGPVYIYNHYKESGPGFKGFNTSNFGLRTFAQAKFVKFFYLWAEYQGINTQYPSSFDLNGEVVKDSYWDNATLVGFGFYLQTGRRGGVSAQVLYNLTPDDRSPYYEDIIYRVGYFF